MFSRVLGAVVEGPESHLTNELTLVHRVFHVFCSCAAALVISSHRSLEEVAFSV